MNEAQQYVGTDETSGGLQLELLKREGCVPSSKVLDIGCGCLSAGLPIMRYLDIGNYVGIEPNRWLIEAALESEEDKAIFVGKNARILFRDDFNASEIGTRFDFVLAHSVLSHAAHWQLGQFLGNSASVLGPWGKIMASIRLAEGNAWGSVGSVDKDDSKQETW